MKTVLDKLSTDFLPFLFPDAGAIWSAAALVMATVTAFLLHQQNRIARKAAAEPKPIVSIHAHQLGDAPGWYNATLTVMNKLPCALRCENLTLAKPKKGFALVAEGELLTANSFGELVFDRNKVAAHKGNSNIIVLNRRVQPEGFTAGSHLERKNPDHASIPFFIRDLRSASSSASKPSIVLKMRLSISCQDATQRRIVITVISRL